MITFTVPGTPVAQPRHQISTHGGFARAYIPAKHAVHKYKADVKEAALVAYGLGKPLLTCPIQVIAVFVMDRPKVYNAKRFSQGRLWYDRQPDIDNFMKALFDGITGMIWENDSQVCDTHCQKFYAAIGEQPHALVTIKEIT